MELGLALDIESLLLSSAVLESEAEADPKMSFAEGTEDGGGILRFE